MLRLSLSVLGCLGILAGIAGCGSGGRPADRPKTAPATVTVICDGQPLEGASVVLTSTDPARRGAMGMTDAAGIAKLMTFEAGDGAIPGEYKVAIQKAEGAPQQSVSMENYDEYRKKSKSGQSSGSAKSVVPAKYTKADTSGLTAKVEKGAENSFKFELQK